MEIKSVSIPKSWEGVSIGQWKEMIEVSQEEGLSELELNIEFLSILTGLEVDEIYSFPLNDVNNLLRQIKFLSEPPKPSDKVKKKYTINGKKYTVFKRLEEITTSQYLDFQNYSKDMDKNIGEILAVFLIPEGHKYNEGYDLNETIEDIKGNDGINVRDALCLMSFFGNLFLKSTLHSLNYSIRAARKMMEKMRKENPEKAKELEEQLKELCSSGSLLLMQSQKQQD